MYWTKDTDGEATVDEKTRHEDACEEPEVCSVEYACLLVPPLSAQYEVRRTSMYRTLGIDATTAPPGAKNLRDLLRTFQGSTRCSRTWLNGGAVRSGPLRSGSLTWERASYDTIEAGFGIISSRCWLDAEHNRERSVASVSALRQKPHGYAPHQAHAPWRDGLRDLSSRVVEVALTVVTKLVTVHVAASRTRVGRGPQRERLGQRKGDRYAHLL